MRTGAIFARGSCRALKWMALFSVVFALGAASGRRAAYSGRHVRRRRHQDRRADDRGRGIERDDNHQCQGIRRRRRQRGRENGTRSGNSRDPRIWKRRRDERLAGDRELRPTNRRIPSSIPEVLSTTVTLVFDANPAPTTGTGSPKSGTKTKTVSLQTIAESIAEAEDENVVLMFTTPRVGLMWTVL